MSKILRIINSDYIGQLEMEKGLEKMQAAHSELKMKKIHMQTLTELVACGIDITDPAGANGRNETAESFATLTGKLSHGDRARYMIKHGNAAMVLVRAHFGTDRPTFDQFSVLMNKSEAYSAHLFEMAISHDELQLRKATNHVSEHTFGLDPMVGDIAHGALYRAARFADSGCNQFVVSPELTAALMLTDVPKLNQGELRLPYRAFMISLAPGAVPFFMRAGEPEWADALLIVQSADEDEILLVVKSRGLEISCTTSFAPEDEPQATSEQPFAPEDEITISAARRLLTNFLLWLNAEGGIQPHHRSKVAPKLAEKRKRSGEEWPREWIFGKDVVLSRELKRSAAEIALGRSNKHAIEGWKLRSRFTVRGHWRNQAHGPGQSLRTRKWIAPHWKGPAEAEAWAHIYKDKK